MFLNIFAVSLALNSTVKHGPPGELGSANFWCEWSSVSISTHACEII